MFLDEVSLLSILSWVESHPVTVGVGTAVIAGSLWFYKFIKQKQAEALFGFYMRLTFQLKNLRTWLNDKNLLELENSDKGNIYTLIYSNDTKRYVCSGFHAPNDNELEEIKELTQELEKTLIKSYNNVYPKISDKKKWYDQQLVLFKFCKFIKNKSLHGCTSKPQDEDKEPEHITKCRELINAMDYIQGAIENELY